MAALPLLYVHGAGPQQPAPAFKHEADMILFGRDMSTTKVAHYSDVRWPPAGSGPTAAPNRAGKTRRVAAIRGSMAPQVSPTEAADAIVVRHADGAASPRHERGSRSAAPDRGRCRRRPPAGRAALPARRPGREPIGGSDRRPRPRRDLPGSDLPVHRRQAGQRRHRLPVRSVDRGDAGAGPRRPSCAARARRSSSRTASAR